VEETHTQSKGGYKKTYNGGEKREKQYKPREGGETYVKKEDRTERPPKDDQPRTGGEGGKTYYKKAPQFTYEKKYEPKQ